MAEPQPPTVREGASSPPPPTTAPAAPGTAEDRKAAAALSSLDARNDDDDAASAGRSVDAEALGKAMAGAGQAGGKGKAGEGPEVKKVKVEQADVALLVSVFRPGMGWRGGLTLWGDRLSIWSCLRHGRRSF